MKKTLLLSALLAVTGVANAQLWVKQNTFFINESEGVQDITPVSNSVVWAFGYDGSGNTANFQDFTRTTDGGTSWSSGVVALGDPELEFTNISPVSATTAWVGAVSPTVGMGGVWKTSDGGNVWTQQNATAYTNAASFFNVVHFFDANVGVTQGDPINGAFELYKTTNGGTSWTAITGAPAPASGEYGYNGGNVAAGTSFWFVTNQGKLYRTTDQGSTWTKLNTPITDFSGTATGGSIFFSDNNNGILIARTGPVATATYTLYKTSNGGTTWSAGAAYNQPYTGFVSYVKGTSILVATGRTGAGTAASPYVFSSAYSLDNATTWTVIESTTQGTATVQQKTGIAFNDPSTGWAGGFVDVNLEGGIFKYVGPALSVSDVIANSVKLVAYPNPATSVINVKGASINKIVAYDLLGKEVLSQEFSSQDEVSINVSSLKTGMYIMNVYNDNGAAQTMKFTKS